MRIGLIDVDGYHADRRHRGRANEESIRRRRECLCCGRRFGTVEIVVEKDRQKARAGR